MATHAKAMTTHAATWATARAGNFGIVRSGELSAMLAAFGTLGCDSDSLRRSNG